MVPSSLVWQRLMSDSLTSETARILDGARLSAVIRSELTPRVEAFARQHGCVPGLGVVLVGENPASEIYVRNKIKAADEIGLHACLERIPASASLDDFGAIAACSYSRT